MENIDLTYIIPMILSLVSFIWFFLNGKKVNNDSNKEKKTISYIPLFSVLALVVGVLIITQYYQNQLSIEKQKFDLLKQQQFLNDSIFLNNQARLASIDSLNKLRNQLNNLLLEVKRQEKITGNNSNLKEKIKNKIDLTQEEIGIANSYNEIIPIPKYLQKGHSTIDNGTSNFLFICPKDTTEFLDLKFRFQDEKIIDKIDCIYLTVTEFKDDKKLYHVFSQAYKAKAGVNAIKIRNYLKNNNVYFELGYMLKSEINKEYPRFERITCH